MSFSNLIWQVTVIRGSLAPFIAMTSSTSLGDTLSQCLVLLPWTQNIDLQLQKNANPFLPSRSMQNSFFWKKFIFKFLFYRRIWHEWECSGALFSERLKNKKLLKMTTTFRPWEVANKQGTEDVFHNIFIFILNDSDRMSKESAGAAGVRGSLFLSVEVSGRPH